MRSAGKRALPCGTASDVFCGASEPGDDRADLFLCQDGSAETLAEEPVPIILDDVFAFYDDKRLESVLKWLSRQEKQVIIFTCHKREERMLNAAQGK